MAQRDFSSEFIFSASRSSGPGGQHANKVSTKMELRFQVDNSVLLSDSEKALLKQRLSNHITASGFLIIYSQEFRSQAKNKTVCEDKFYRLLESGLARPKKRIKTKLPHAVKVRIRESKQHRSAMKKLRQKPRRFD